VNVMPKTFIGWHRAGFRLFWRWKSRPGRPRIPAELRDIIREMALSNASWGEERIANELLLKLGIRVSPRTVRKYMPKRLRGQPRGDQRYPLAFIATSRSLAFLLKAVPAAMSSIFEEYFVFSLR